MHLSLIWQLPTCLRPNSLNERSPFSGFAFWRAELRLLAQNRQIGGFGDNGRCTLPAESRQTEGVCGFGLSADNRSDTATRKATQSLGSAEGSADRNHLSALQAKSHLFPGVSREAFEVPMSEAVWKRWFDRAKE
jgi:hypothetical protein